MMEFYKYQGTGNDFIMIDNRDLHFKKETSSIERLCDRRFGIGGDGLILLENTEYSDFKMVYYNSDGNESTMCGNGGRCLVAFAHFLNIFDKATSFLAIDGLHEAKIMDEVVQLKMIDVNAIEKSNDDYILNTGSPHYVKFVEKIEQFDVYKNGFDIRNSLPFKKDGINVNFIEKIGENKLFVRTFERGVEDETFSCGTGVTAAALVYILLEGCEAVEIQTLGGNLKVYAAKNGLQFQNIWLEGSAKQVFKGELK